MKPFIPLLVAICCPVLAFCQDITGFWKGSMYNDSTKQSLPYEMIITKEYGKYTGYSHSWFLVNGKEYYGIKKIKVRVAKDGKIIVQDAALIDNNYPVLPDKNVSQLNVLDITSGNNEITLEGPFVTNRTKAYNELTGRISLKKVTGITESALMKYLQKHSADNDISAVK